MKEFFWKNKIELLQKTLFAIIILDPLTDFTYINFWLRRVDLAYRKVQNN